MASYHLGYTDKWLCFSIKTWWVKSAFMCILVSQRYKRDTYTFHFHDSKDVTGHEHS